MTLSKILSYLKFYWEHDKVRINQLFTQFRRITTWIILSRFSRLHQKMDCSRPRKRHHFPSPKMAAMWNSVCFKYRINYTKKYSDSRCSIWSNNSLHFDPCTYPRPPTFLDGLLDVVSRHRIRQRGSRFEHLLTKFPSTIPGVVNSVLIVNWITALPLTIAG